MSDIETNAAGDAQLGVVLRKARLQPDLPPGFQGAVWRRIESAEVGSTTEEGSRWLDRLVESLLRPRLALSLLALVLAAGGISGAAGAVSGSRQLAQQRYLATVAPAGAALNFADPPPGK